MPPPLEEEEEEEEHDDDCACRAAPWDRTSATIDDAMRAFSAFLVDGSRYRRL
jgi:hypothetical protein